MNLSDQFNRKVTNLRLSVIDRCNLRCQYCIINEKVSWVPKSDLLSFEEYLRLVKLFSDLGINTIRITGGEPLVRPRISSLIEDIVSVSGIKQVNMTTNGVLLNLYLESLEDAGLNSLNISLDTLNQEKYLDITKRDQLFSVLSNIKQALETKINVKINCVAMKGFNDNEILDFVDFSVKNNVTLRFIELMPFNGNNWLNASFISSSEIRKIIETRYSLKLEPLENQSQTSRNFRIKDNPGRIGFISSVSDSFCKWCNRVRITAEGSLRTCLHDPQETDLRILLRNGSNDEHIRTLIKKTVFEKQKGHIDWIDPHVVWKIPLDDREMLRIGG